MTFLHCSRSRKYFPYFGSLFLFLLNRLATFCFWLNSYWFLTPQVHPGTYSAPEVWLRHRYEVVTHTKVARQRLWPELYVYFEVIVRGDSRINYLWKRPYYAGNSEARFSETAWERWLKTCFVLGSSSSLSSLEFSFSSSSLSCSSSTKSIFLFIAISTDGRFASNE